MRIIVLNCYSRMGLAVTNALDPSYDLIGGHGDQGIPGVRGFERRLKSPRLREIFRYPEPHKDEAGFHEAILDACRRYEADGVFPASSGTAVGLSRLKQRARGEVAARFVVEDYDTLVRLADKWGLHQLAVELGVPSPRTVLPAGDGVAELAELRLPVVAKPRMAEASTGILFIDSREELDAFVADPPRVGSQVEGYPYIVQQVEPGEIHCASGCWQAGRVVSLSSNHRVLTRHEFGGQGIVHHLTDEPEIMEYAERMLGHVGWSGPAQLEFIRDPAGRYHLLDCNVRVWGSTELVVAAGMNVCQQAVDVMVSGRELERQREYVVGMAAKWWTLGSVARCFRSPRTPDAIARRLRLLLARSPGGGTVSNLRRGNFRHLAGIVVDTSQGRRRRARARKARGSS